MLKLTGFTVNKKNVLRKYIDTIANTNSTNEMISFYGDFGVLKRFRIGLPGLRDTPLTIVNGMNYNVDYLLNHCAGTSFNRLTISDTIFSGGKGLKMHQSFVSALGESFERIMGSLYFFEDQHSHMFGSYKELSEKHHLLNPNNYQIFTKEENSDERHPFAVFDENCRIRWAKFHSFSGEKELWIPSQLVYLLYIGDKQESMIGYSSSGGLSCHNTESNSLRHGGYELVERDAINICWNCKIPPKELVIDQEVNDITIRKLLKEHASKFKDVRFYLHFSEYAYVVTAIKIDENLKKYYFLAGGGVGETLDHAIEGAIAEYIQAEHNLKSLIYTPKWRAAEGINFLFNVPEDVDFTDLKLFYQIIPYYGFDRNFKKLEWYLAGKEKCLYSKIISKEDTFKKIAHSTFYKNFTMKQFQYLKICKSFNPDLTLAYTASLPMRGHMKYKKYLKGKIFTDDPIPFP